MHPEHDDEGTGVIDYLAAIAQVEMPYFLSDVTGLGRYRQIRRFPPPAYCGISSRAAIPSRRTDTAPAAN
jgi:hypothetical protein